MHYIIRKLINTLLLPLCFGLTLAALVQGQEHSIDNAQTETSKENIEHHLYTTINHPPYSLSIYSASIAPPFNKIHSWLIQVTDENGQPIPNLSISVTGGMKLHKHGLPTQPKIRQGEMAGKYYVDGLKFQMYGDWFLALNLKDKQGSDVTLKYPFTVKPRII